jgi:hypothetical protein
VRDDPEVGRPEGERSLDVAAGYPIPFNLVPSFSCAYQVWMVVASALLPRIQLERRCTVAKEKDIVQPMIDEMKELQKPKESGVPAPPGGTPLQPAELDQDSGGGYNPDGTFPQT